jgi:hypothetical protein
MPAGGHVARWFYRPSHRGLPDRHPFGLWGGPPRWLHDPVRGFAAVDSHRAARPPPRPRPRADPRVGFDRRGRTAWGPAFRTITDGAGGDAENLGGVDQIGRFAVSPCCGRTGSPCGAGIVSRGRRRTSSRRFNEPYPDFFRLALRDSIILSTTYLSSTRGNACPYSGYRPDVEVRRVGSTAQARSPRALPKRSRCLATHR